MNLKTEINFSNYSRYIEVILGSGETFFELNPEVPCILNDSNTDLINFYRHIHEPDLQKELDDLGHKWELIGEFSNFSCNEILIAFNDLNQGIISSEDVEYMVRAIVMMNMLHERFTPLFEQKFVASIDLFNNALINPVVETLLQLKGDDLAKIYNSKEEGFRENIETAFRKGFFRHFRSLLNWQKTELIDCLTLYKNLACWRFIKEFSKESYLNYDKNGNIKNHFGGSSFNKKSFKDIVNKLLHLNNISSLQNASLHNNTPIQFIKDIDAGKKDLVIANICESNLILSVGKNYINKSSQINQVMELAKLDLNLLIITDDKKLGIELESVSGGSLSTKSENNKILISNLNK